MADLPSFQDYLNAGQMPPSLQPAPQGIDTPPSTGTGNWLTAGLGSGFHQALGQVGGAVQAGAKLVGADDTAQSAADFAASQRAQAATYARPDLEEHPWSPAGMAYQLAQGVPSFAGMLGVGALSAIGAPEEAAAGAGVLATAGARRLLGTAAAAYPLSVGSNVERQEQYDGDLTQGQAGKALALGVPEAALNTILPHQLEGALANGMGGDIVNRIVKGAAQGAAIQGGVGALTEYLTAQMGDPNRTFAEKAQNVVQAAVGGAFQGAVFGGAIHALAKTPVADVQNDQLSSVVDQAVNKTTPQVEVPQNAPVEQPPAPFNGTQGELDLGDRPAPTEAQLLKQYAGYETQPEGQLNAVALPDALATMVQRYPSNALTQLVDGFQEAKDRGLLKPGDQVLHDAMNAELVQRGLRPPPVPEVPAGPPETPPVPPTPFNQPIPEEPVVAPVEAQQAAQAEVPAELPLVGDQGPVADVVPPFDPAQIRTETPRLPKTLTDGVSSLDELKQRVADHLNAKDAAGEKPVSSVVALADKLGVSTTDPQYAPKEPVISKAPITDDPRSAIVDRVRQMAQSIPHDPDFQSLMTTADDIQSRIAAKQFKGVAQDTRDLQAAVEGKIAQQRIQPTIDLTKDQGYYSAPVNDDTKPTPIAAKAVEQIKATKSAGATRDPSTKPTNQTEALAQKPELTRAGDDAKFTKAKPRNQKEALAQKAAAKSEAVAPAKLIPQIEPVKSAKPSQPIRDSLSKAYDLVGKLRDEGKVTGYERDQASPEFAKYKDKALADAVKKGKPEPDTAEMYKKFRAPIEQRQTQMQSEVARQQEKLNQFSDHATAMDRGDTSGFRATKDGFLGTKLFDDHYDNANSDTQKMIDAYDAHTQGEGGLMDTIREHTGPGPLPLLGQDKQLTQHDKDLSYIIHQTSDVRNGNGLLGHLIQYGSSAQVREMARILKDQGVDPRVKFAPVDPRLSADKYGVPFASINPRTNDISIHRMDDVETSVMHEMVHAATVKAIKAGGEGAQEIQRLFDHVKQFDDGTHYGLKNTKEFVAEAMSNPTFQKFLMSLDAPKGSKVMTVWKAFKNAVFRALGGTPRAMTAFDAVMDSTHKLMNENRGLETPIEQGDRALRTVGQGADAIYRRVQDISMADATGKLLNVQEGWRKQVLGWTTNSHIAQVWGKLVPGLRELVGLQHHDSVRSDTLAKHSVAAYMKLKALPKDVQHFVEHMMARSVQNIDPSKTWAEHTWLHGSKESSVLQQEVVQANNEWRKLNANPLAREAYDAAKFSNEADRLRHQAQFARDMMRAQGMDGAYDGFRSDPFADYERQRNLHDDPAKAMAFWRGVTDAQKQGMLKFQGELSGARDIHNSVIQTEQARRAVERTQGFKVDENAFKLRQQILTDATNERARLSRNYETVKDMVDDFGTADRRANEGTYFHLSREGTHFVAGHIAADPDGTINAANAQLLQQRMQKAGFNDAAIMRGGENTSVYVRVQDADQMARLRQVFLKAHGEGVLDQSRPVSAGEAGTTDIYKAISPVWMKRLIAAAEAAQPDIPEGVSTETADALVRAYAQQKRDLTRTMLNMTPENSLSRLYAHRENVQGFSTHMIESFGKSSIANARGTSRLSLAEDMAQSMRNIKDQVRANNENATLQPNQILGGAQAAAELIQREKNRETSVPSNFMDAVRQMTHTFQVGASPAYAFTLMTQIPTLSLPELAKTHGFANSALALGRAAPLAIKVMRAVMAGPDATRFGMRDETLRAAGISDKDVDFIMNQAMRGDFHHSSYTQAMAGHGPLSQGEIGKYTAAANAMGLYSEMMPRVLTAIAARDLYEKAPQKAQGMALHDFVSNKVSQSQMDWSPSGNARQTTKQGMFGSMSPLINQFMGFQIRLTEKMYREVADAFGKGRTPEERAGAQRFLIGHAAAVTMFAGTLGLPMLSTAAAVYDKLRDLVTGEDNNDVQASYRTFLAHTFGKEVGEVIARGLPRAFGADFDHVGEGRIIPGSSFVNFLAEKRSMEDAEKDWLKSEAGSATGFLMNLALAGRDFANQDYNKALTKMVPEIMKSPVEAYQIAERGFVDKNGAKLPITANAFDIAMKALGIDPAKEAEYDEVKRTATGLNTMRQLREKNITQHLVLAVNRGDTANEQYWLNQSQLYQQDHPGLLPPAADLGRNLAKSLRNASVARGLGLPIGENLKDISTRGMVGFGNFRNQ